MTHEVDRELTFKLGSGSTLLLACGALAKDIVTLLEANGLTHLDVQCLPAQLHHTPERIPDAVRRRIRENKAKYRKIFVVYGDCGTAGALDRVLEEEGDSERIPGPHCFSFYFGNESFLRHGEDEIGTFCLTDFFCRFFEKFIWEAYGLHGHESMVEFVFGHYEKLVYMPQVEDAASAKRHATGGALKSLYESDLRPPERNAQKVPWMAYPDRSLQRRDDETEIAKTVAMTLEPPNVETGMPLRLLI